MNHIENNMIGHFVLKIQRGIMIVTGVLITMIMFVETILRIIGVNFVGYEELILIVAFWLYMTGSAYASAEKTHIRADVISFLMKDGPRKDFINLFERLLTLLLGLVFLFWAYNFIVWSAASGSSTPAWRIPNVVGQSSVVLGLALMTVYNLVHLVVTYKEFIKKYYKKSTIPSV